MELTAAAAAMDERREERRRRGRAIEGRARETKGRPAAIGAPRPTRAVGVAGKGVEEKQAIVFQPRRAG